MPRGRRRAVPDAESLERELEELKRRQAELRTRLRQIRSGAASTQKLEEKLLKQLGTAKWTVQQIKQLQPGWDDLGFYQSVSPARPAARGRRRAAAAPEGE